jgi:hypothetical protein
VAASKRAADRRVVKLIKKPASDILFSFGYEIGILLGFYTWRREISGISI